MVLTRAGLTLAFLCLAGGCKDESKPAASRIEALSRRSASPASTGPEAAEPPKPLRARMLHWLDPDAPLAAYVTLPPETDMDALCVVFAVPPRIESMLRAVSGLQGDLEAVLDPEDPPPTTWLRDEAIAMSPLISTGTYVVRGLRKPREEVMAILERAGMRKQETEGFATFRPKGAFPWKLAFLEPDIAAFIPAQEVGSGLGPLTAGRDLPPKELGQELGRVIEREPEALLEVLGRGPFLHLDLPQEVFGVRFSLRTFQDGMDGQIVLQVSRDPEAARRALEARKVPEETDAIQDLVDDVAFLVNGPVVEGRLQIVGAKALAVRK